MLDFLNRLFGRDKTDDRSLHGASELPFECISASGAEAPSVLSGLRSKTGITPVLLGDASDLEMMVENLSMNTDSYDKIRDDALALDVEAWIAQQSEEDPDYYAIDETVTGDVEPLEIYTPTRDILTGKPKREVFVGLIPTDEPWLVPAHLKAGGWNECPEPAVHAAFFRRWEEKYGAKVVTVANDVVEFEVDRPPQTDEAALELAREQFAYCADIVHQGVNTVGNLAAVLKGSRGWYFWWD